MLMLLPVQASRCLFLRGATGIWPTSPSHDEQTMLIDKGPYTADDREVDVNGKRYTRLYMGGILGRRHESLHGGAFGPDLLLGKDFQPGKYYGKRIPRSIWRLADFLCVTSSLTTMEAERLYWRGGPRVRKIFPHSKNPSCGYPGDPLPLHPLNHRLDKAANRVHGLPSVSFASRHRLVTLPAAAALRRFPLPHGCCSSVGSASRAMRSPTDFPSQSKRSVEVEQLIMRNLGSRATLISVALTGTSGQRSHYRARRWRHSSCHGAIGSSLLLLRLRTGQSAGRPTLYDAPFFDRRQGVYAHASSTESSFRQARWASPIFISVLESFHTRWALCNHFPFPALSCQPRSHRLCPPPCASFSAKPHSAFGRHYRRPTQPHKSCGHWARMAKLKLTHRFGRYDKVRAQTSDRLRSPEYLKRSGAVYSYFSPGYFG